MWWCGTGVGAVVRPGSCGGWVLGRVGGAVSVWVRWWCTGVGAVNGYRAGRENGF